ncbi:uncharacterized protein LOC131665511 [Phymastichus coffea]|uniref:uncharacterized protein LOC131665511 n=1 Tax=Phymastichus coffea TaxID=108790 RepID=UPI00273B7B67|nr:uncharacterized protein LOC131665511 [Phymastichus coffea]
MHMFQLFKRQSSNQPASKSNTDTACGQLRMELRVDSSNMLSTLAIVIVFLHLANAQILSRTFNFTESQLIKNHPWHDNTKLLYARCNSSQPQLGKKCIISVTAEAFENSTIVSSECTVTLKSEIPKTLVNDSLLVFKFGSDRVIIMWMESQNTTSNGLSILKTSVVHMADQCQIFGTTVHSYLGQFTVEMAYQKYFNIIASQDTYELVLKDVVNDCKFRANCTFGDGIVKFDKKARKLSGPEHWPTPIYNDKWDIDIIVAVEPGHSENGYFVFNRNDKQSIAYLATREKDDYKKLILKETPFTRSNWFSGISLANQAIGICYHFSSNSSITCWQFNQRGQLLLYKLLIPKRQHDVPVAAVYNIKNGGFLLVVVDCPKNDCDGSKNDNHFIKIGKERQVDVVKIRFDAKCNQQENSQMTFRAFENKKSQYCIARLCDSKIHNSVRLDAKVHCFSSSAFSKCNDCI